MQASVVIWHRCIPVVEQHPVLVGEVIHKVGLRVCIPKVVRADLEAAVVTLIRAVFGYVVVIEQLILGTGRYPEAGERPAGVRLSVVGGIASDVDLIDHEATPVNATISP